ncbi:MAG: hypothetical protein AB7E68_05685 [Candidatus Babeliales bacterium]
MKKILLFLVIKFFTSSLGAFTITDPGFFALGGNLIESGTVIRISTSNLTVDLGGYTVSGGVSGIVIDAGLTNVTVQNGFLDSNVQGITIGAGCSDIIVQNMSIIRCTRSGLEVNGTDASQVMRLTVKNITVELSTIFTSTVDKTIDSIMTFSNVVELMLQDIILQQNGDNTINLTGVRIINCSKATVENVLMLNNQGASFQGIFVENTNSSFFNKVQIRMNTAANLLVGIRFTGGILNTGNLCQNFSVLNNSSTSGPLAGFELLPFVTKNIITDCVAQNNNVSGSTVGANCIGFNLDQPTFCALIGCQALYNTATGNAGNTAFAAGFNIGTSAAGATTGTKNCAFYNNVATANNAATGTANGNANSYGMRVVSGNGGNVNNIFIGNRGILNGPVIPVTNTNQISSGTGGLAGGNFLDRTSATFTTVTSYTAGLVNLRITS